MTTTSNHLFIAAPAQTIYRYAAATEHWPQYLPHYRYVRLLGNDGPTRVVEMAAWRDFIPVRWVAEQTNDSARPHIHFRHIRGWTKGMDVEWRFEPQAGGTNVTIEHRLQFSFPVAADLIAHYVIGEFFIKNIAAKTLRRIQALAEAQG
ncbi:MAG TPA: SRPBCC family protein [Candidatus Baltobacteraceae bacterium]